MGKAPDQRAGRQKKEQSREARLRDRRGSFKKREFQRKNASSYHLNEIKRQRDIQLVQKGGRQRESGKDYASKEGQFPSRRWEKRPRESVFRGKRGDTQAKRAHPWPV